MDKENYDNYIKQLEEQNEALVNELVKLKSKPQGRIGYIFLIIGLIFFAFSIDYSSSIIAFLSLALLFWGGLFLYIRPTNFIRQEILFSNLKDTYSLYSQILDAIDYQGIPFYRSPQTLSAFKEVFLILPKNKDDLLNINEKKITSANLNYSIIEPLGLGIANLMEEEIKLNFSTVNLEQLSKLIEKILIEDLELVKEYESRRDGSLIQIKIVESIFDSFYDDIKMFKEEHYNYDYLISAIACSYAKSTHKPIVIENISKEKNGTITNANLRIL